MTPSPTRLLPPKAEQLFQPSLPWAHLSPSQAPLLPPRSSAPLGQALLRAADGAAPWIKTAKEVSIFPGEPRSPVTGRVAVEVTGPMHSGHLSNFPSSSGGCWAPGQGLLSFAKVRDSFSAAEERSQEPNTSMGEREQTSALEGGDKLWRRIQTFCQNQKLPCSLRECSFQACSLACRQTHTHSSSPLLETFSKAAARRDLCGNFELTSVLWPLCSAQKVGQ